MKFWKHSLLAATVFMTLATAVTYTSCKHDSCKALMCRNGGTCADEFCRCPTGYEGTQCETVSRTKFVGNYEGITQINGQPVIRDFAEVSVHTQSYNITALQLTIATRSPEKIIGTVAANGMEVEVPPTATRKVTWKLDSNGNLEIVIEEMLDGEKKISEFRGHKV